MRQTLIAVLGAALLLSSGCSVSTKPSGVSASTKPPPISTGTLEKKVSSALAKQVGQTPDSVSCPQRLEAKKGATVRCVLTAGSDRFGVTVRTTSVDDGGHVHFGVKVDDKKM